MDGRENENKTSSAAPQPIFTPPASDGSNNHASNLPAPVGSISPVENSGTFASSGQGDIILNNAPRKSALNKKPLIIGAVAIIITIVIMMVFLFIKGSGRSRITAVSEKKFHQYANYLLFGEDKDTALPAEYDRWSVYNLEEQLENDTFGQTYWDKTETLLNESVDKYHELGDSANTTLLAALDEYRNAYRFLRAYHQLAEPNESTIVSTLADSGKSAATSYTKEIFDPLLEFNVIYADSYVDYKLAQYGALIDYYDQYNIAGCLVSGEINNTCPQINDEALLEYIDMIDQSAFLADEAIESLVQFLTQDCWTISKQFQNPITLPSEKEAK